MSTKIYYPKPSEHSNLYKFIASDVVACNTFVCQRFTRIMMSKDTKHTDTTNIKRNAQYWRLEVLY